MPTFWLSFADDISCNGVVITEALDAREAYELCSVRGLAPPGHVAIIQLDPDHAVLAHPYLDRLLLPDELIRLPGGLKGKRTSDRDFDGVKPLYPELEE